MANRRSRITNVLAQAIGHIATQHPNADIEIIWAKEEPEEFWLILAHVRQPGLDFYGYLVNDETGLYVVAHEETLREWLGPVADGD